MERPTEEQHSNLVRLDYVVRSIFHKAVIEFEYPRTAKCDCVLHISKVPILSADLNSDFYILPFSLLGSPLTPLLLAFWFQE